MTSHMLPLARDRLAASPLASSTPCPLTIKSVSSSSHTTLQTPLFQECPSLFIHCKPQKRFLWSFRAVRACAIASSRESDSTGFPRKKLAVFVSGGGSNFRTLHQASLQNKIFGDFVLVVSDKPACKACDYARASNIPIVEYPHNRLANCGLSPSELVSALRQHEVDIVLLAGYLKLLPKEVIHAFPRAIVNIHPALLPAFGGKGYYGRKVHEAVIKSGARYSGPTIHFVDEKYDHGYIVAQRVVPVLPYDTADDLAARVLKEEHTLYPEVIAALCEDRIFWREDHVPLIRRSWNEAEFY